MQQVQYGAYRPVGQVLPVLRNAVPGVCFVIVWRVQSGGQSGCKVLSGVRYADDSEMFILRDGPNAECKILC